jgi:hypothetical protein
MKEVIYYKDVVELGFKRIDSYDSVWEDRHGFKYFIMSLNLTPEYTLQWDIIGKFVEVLHIKEDGFSYDTKFALHRKKDLEAFIERYRIKEYLCDQCGGKDVHSVAWVDVNSKKYKEEYQNAKDGCWCNNCKCYVDVEKK